MTALDQQDHPHVDVQEPSTETAPASAPPSEEEAFLQAVRARFIGYDAVYAVREAPLQFELHIFADDLDAENLDRAAYAKLELWDLFPDVTFDTHMWLSECLHLEYRMPPSAQRLV